MGLSIGIEAEEAALAIAIEGHKRNHAGVIATRAEGRQHKPHAHLLAERLVRVAQRGIRRHAAA